MTVHKFNFHGQSLSGTNQNINIFVIVTSCFCCSSFTQLSFIESTCPVSPIFKLWQNLSPVVGSSAHGYLFLSGSCPWILTLLSLVKWVFPCLDMSLMPVCPVELWARVFGLLSCSHLAVELFILLFLILQTVFWTLYCFGRMCFYRSFGLFYGLCVFGPSFRVTSLRDGFSFCSVCFCSRYKEVTPSWTVFPLSPHLRRIRGITCSPDCCDSTILHQVASTMSPKGHRG